MLHQAIKAVLCRHLSPHCYHVLSDSAVACHACQSPECGSNSTLRLFVYTTARYTAAFALCTAMPGCNLSMLPHADGYLPKRRQPLLAAFDLGQPEALEARARGGDIRSAPNDDEYSALFAPTRLAARARPQ
jgi:hypothetical protein